MNIEGIIPNLVARLDDSDSDVRATAVEALRTFTASDYGRPLEPVSASHPDWIIDLYHSHIKSSLLTITKKLDEEAWTTRREAIRLLTIFSENGNIFRPLIIRSLSHYFFSPFPRNDRDKRSHCEVDRQIRGS
jgi:hypothetical protein